MKPFGGKYSARPSGERDALSTSSEPQPAHRLTLELQRAETLAVMLAHSRSSNLIEVSDYLAGMYICNWDHLSEYWNEQERDDLEILLRDICRISPQRWHSWIELYDQQRHENDPKKWHLFRSWKKQSPGETLPQFSDALAIIFRQAEELAPAYDRTDKRSIPVLNLECVLLSIVRNLGSEVSRRLALSGLDIERLEREVLLPRRRPRT
jgi:hypothetical protein